MRFSHPTIMIEALLLALLISAGKVARAEDDLSFMIDLIDWEDEDDHHEQSHYRHGRRLATSAAHVDMGSPFKLETVLMSKGSAPWKAVDFDSATEGPLTITPCLWYDNPCGYDLCVSFMMPNPSGGQPLYLRHWGFKMHLTPYGSSDCGGMDALMKHSSYCLKPGFVDGHQTFAFQSASHMQHYIHQRADGSLWAELTGNQEWIDDGASFYYQLPKTPVDAGLYLGSTFTLQSVLAAQGGAAPMIVGDYDQATQGPLTITSCLLDNSPCGEAPCVALMLPDPAGGQPFYLRHWDYKMRLDQFGSPHYGGNAALIPSSSFCLRPGYVNGHGTLSLQSTNMMGNYLHHGVDGLLTAKWRNHHTFSASSASFYYDHPTVAQEVQIESVLNSLGGPSWKGQGQLTSAQPFIFKPCLMFWNNACGSDSCVSLMVNGQHGDKKYLRHAGYKLRLTQYGADAILEADGSFCLRPGHAQAESFSLESVNFPGYFMNVRRDGLLGMDVVNNAEYTKESASFHFKVSPDMCNTYNPCETGFTCTNPGVCYPTSSLPTPTAVPIQQGTPIGHEFQLVMDPDEPPIGPIVLRPCPLAGTTDHSCATACVSVAAAGNVDSVVRANPSDSHIRMNHFSALNDVTAKKEASFCLQGAAWKSTRISLESVEWTGHVLTMDETTKALRLANSTALLMDRTAFEMTKNVAPMCHGSHQCASGYFCHHLEPQQSLCYPKRKQGETCELDKECMGSLTCNLELVGFLWKGSFAKFCGPADGSDAS